MEQASFFCRTYNLPFKPELWMKMAKEYKGQVFKEYALFVLDIHQNEQFQDKTGKVWSEATKEWELLRTHEELIVKLKPLKEGYMLRNQIKWGSNYTFEELIQLENLFVNTLKANSITNPMQKDAIKKACKMSVALDRAIMNGDSKEINEFSKAYQNFVKTAKIDDLITESSQDVISNVAQLVQYIEEQGFQFNYYDGVSRDIVDKSLIDMQNFIQRLVVDSTGLDVIFETIASGLRREIAVEKDAESFAEVPLEDLYAAELEVRSEEFDNELEEEEVDLSALWDEGDEEDDYFQLFE